MTLQTVVRDDLGYGIPGEVRFDGPHRAQPFRIDPNATAANCVFGRVFTYDDATNTVKPGGDITGTVTFAGIASSPKNYPNRGVGGDPMAPNLNMTPGYVYEFTSMGFVCVVSVEAQAARSMLAYYDITDGTIHAGPADGSGVAANWRPLPGGKFDHTAQAAAGAVVVVRLTN